MTRGEKTRGVTPPPGMTLRRALIQNFLGHSPRWYKLTLIAFLAGNPVVLALAGPTATGWLLLLEFIFVLASALKCYPLQPGGLLALEAVLLGLTTPAGVYSEVETAFPVILLLIFMVAAIYFLQDLLLYVFSKLLTEVDSQLGLALVFLLTSAVLSAFLDALTVVAVVLTVGMGFYQVYHRIASAQPQAHPDDHGHDHTSDHAVTELHREDLEKFRAFLRGLLMHGAIGTAAGGVATQVGEPQNLLIAKQAGWEFLEFFQHMAPVSLPVLGTALLTCMLLERCRWFGYGTPLPPGVRQVLAEFARSQAAERTSRERAALLVQAVAALVLVVALGLHVAEVGLIGLLILVLTTSFLGVTDEVRLGKAFEAALPFTALLVVFFAIVAVIHQQHLFEPVMTWVLGFEGRAQTAMLYVVNGLLSAISDNVFVATIYITEIKAALLEGSLSRERFEVLAVVINAGTNIPSIATPNGQAAFLFLLTSALAPLIRLSYGRMVWMALPYALTTSTVGLLMVTYGL